MTHQFKNSPSLGKYSPDSSIEQRTIALISAKREELSAAHERIDELKSCLTEMVEIYWGDGDGIHPPPSCIQRAQAALAETVQS